MIGGKVCPCSITIFAYHIDPSLESGAGKGKVLVTGATGFVAGHVIEQLLAKYSHPPFSMIAIN